MKMVEVTCCGCKQSYQKPKKEVDRRTRQGHKTFYCSLSCMKRFDREDEFSDFREILRQSKKRNKGEHNLTLPFLKSLWEKQDGRCPYTSKKMVLSRTKKHELQSASLDRVDSSIGYVEGNVEFVCLFVNLGKNGFSKQSVIDFLAEIKGS